MYIPTSLRVSLKVWPGNLKAYWRWAKVLGALQRWSKAVHRCEIGLEVGRRLEVTEERHKQCFSIAKLRNKLQKKATAASVAKVGRDGFIVPSHFVPMHAYVRVHVKCRCPMLGCNATHT